MTKRLIPFSNSWSAVGFSVAGDHAHAALDARGHRFGRCDILPIDVRDGCRFAIVRVIAELSFVHAGLLRPHRAHRNVVKLLHFHAVGDEGASVLMRFAVVAHAAFFQRSLHLSVVLVGRQVGDGLAQVPQKVVAGLRALHDAPGEHRQPRDADRNRAAW